MKREFEWLTVWCFPTITRIRWWILGLRNICCKNIVRLKFQPNLQCNENMHNSAEIPPTNKHNFTINHVFQTYPQDGKEFCSPSALPCRCKSTIPYRHWRQFDHCNHLDPWLSQTKHARDGIVERCKGLCSVANKPIDLAVCSSPLLWQNAVWFPG